MFETILTAALAAAVIQLSPLGWRLLKSWISNNRHRELPSKVEPKKRGAPKEEKSKDDSEGKAN